MKVLYALGTTESAEPLAVAQFIAGYQSNGATWGGEVVVRENVSNSDFTNEYLDQIEADGYELVIRNTSPGIGDSYNQYDYLISKDILLVSPAGSNNYRYYVNPINNYSIVLCGSGTPEYGNVTGYPCHFYDADPAESEGVEIADIRQCGTVYNITHIQRTSATRIGVMLDGVTDTDSIGLHTHGTPVYFADIVGSDISPLPTGKKYVTYSGTGNFFYINHTTTSGTINNGFGVGNYQAVSAGTMTYGSLTNTDALIRLSLPNLITAGYGVTLDGILGFDRNPNGAIEIKTSENGGGYYDMFTINYDLGAGSYAGGGQYYAITQSYSTPYVAGKLTDIKLNLGCSWAEAIGRALVTASEDNSFDTYNGYGVIDVLSAISIPNRNITLDAPVITSTKITASSYIIEWDIIPNVDIYEVFFRGEKVDEVPAMRTNYLFGGARLTRSKRNFIKVRAKRGETYSDFSNVIEIDYYKNLSILAGAIGNNPYYGYGYNYGANYGT